MNEKNQNEEMSMLPVSPFKAIQQKYIY
jgi:hypothetical protein